MANTITYCLFDPHEEAARLVANQSEQLAMLLGIKDSSAQGKKAQDLEIELESTHNSSFNEPHNLETFTRFSCNSLPSSVKWE